MNHPDDNDMTIGQLLFVIVVILAVGAITLCRVVETNRRLTADIEKIEKGADR